ncbi:DUF6507 family protein [Streptomyces monticola]|uniref:DUF6507 family protein n=1 Tax=Streptomyces monticola TaxID=2666263 RepID=A0ABW2JL28_9ACTN
MTAWDITPSGVNSILSLVGDAGDDLEKHVKAYGKHVESAAASAGTVGVATYGPYVPGSAPRAGIVAAALANFVTDTQTKVAFMAARTSKTMNGTVEATTAYTEGNLQMAADIQSKALAAPDPSELMPKGDGGKQDAK